MITFLCAAFAIFFNTMYMAYVGISIKEAEKSVFLGEVDKYSNLMVMVYAPCVYLSALIVELGSIMLEGMKLLLSEDYRATVIAEEILFESADEG
jgi:hypothetical protein